MKGCLFFNNPEAINILMTSLLPLVCSNAWDVHRNMWLFQGLAKGYLSILLFLALSVNESFAMRPSTRRSTVTMTKVDTAQKVVILGAGIHGASVAHYLSSRFGIFPTVVERVSVAAAASGKAGGFLAREWGSGTTQQLHQVSFDMHEKLGKLDNRLQNLSENPSDIYKC
jgi:FAD dependent oxidoreductase